LQLTIAIMMSKDLRYDKRGVSANKSEVHAAIKNLDKGLFPYAFCKILPDVVAGDANYCNIMHADTAGTKTSLAYMYWKETGDVSVWEGILRDAIVMNIDDMACVGCTQDIVLSSTIGRNKNLIDGDVIKTLIQGTQDFIDELSDLGVDIVLAGGETADVGDIVRTIDVGFTAFARMKRSDVIDSNIKAGDLIVGFASYGQCSYESDYNGGMGSNGLTSARHDVFTHAYTEKYPDSYDSNTPDEVVYMGSKQLTDTVTVDGKEYTVGKLVLSPTRTYLPVINDILNEVREEVHSMIHCTGGAQTKVLKFLKEPVHIIKDKMFDTPPLFKMIQEESGLPWEEMYQVFNMGHRLEVYTPSEEAAEKMIAIAARYNIDAQIIGRVKASSEKKVTVSNAHGNFEYK
jgi:phosphoribosylformylglycinamidine cyclo-ligase